MRVLVSLNVVFGAFVKSLTVGGENAAHGAPPRLMPRQPETNCEKPKCSFS